MRPLTVSIDWEHDDPVYLQIARQIRSGIAAGDLKPGAPLPSMRTLASDLGVNLNTVARAYRVLEDEGFLSIRDRAGAEVAPPSKRPDADLRERLRGELSVVLARLKQAGVPLDDLKLLTEQEIAGLAERGGPEG